MEHRLARIIASAKLSVLEKYIKVQNVARGKVLRSFEINCPACGHGLRSEKASSAVKEFALKLEAIEAR